MISRFLRWIALALLVVSLTGSCLVSNLSNSFDLKSPSGFLGYLGVLKTTAAPDCSFDAGNFDSCSFGP